VPQRKLTIISIVEALFTTADRNKDGLIDIPEFVYFSINNLPKEISLNDMNEALKVMKLFDENNDDKLSSKEFTELLRPELQSHEISSLPPNINSDLPIELKRFFF
jgi:Ca2+-binding EF-hand superfamily protein